MLIYLTVDENNKITRIDTNYFLDSLVANIDEELFNDSTKLLSSKYINGEVVPDEDEYIKNKTEQEYRTKKIESDNKISELLIVNFISTLSDEEAITYKYSFQLWDNDKDYKKNDRFIYNDKFYKVLQDHHSQSNWLPDNSPSLYVEISDPSIEYPEWKQPTGSHDAYSKGDKVTYKGNKYESLIDGNTYNPEEYPAGWKKIN